METTVETLRIGMRTLFPSRNSEQASLTSEDGYVTYEVHTITDTMVKEEIYMKQYTTQKYLSMKNVHNTIV